MCSGEIFCCVIRRKMLYVAVRFFSFATVVAVLCSCEIYCWVLRWKLLCVSV